MTVKHDCSRVVEAIWLNVRREDNTTGRRKIAEVVCCPTCGGGAGPVKSLRSPAVDAVAWAAMKKKHPYPPYYFDQVEDLGGGVRLEPA